MPTIKTACIGAVFALVSACGDNESGEHPTWIADIAPIVRANCLRCHTPPSLGGAPTDFRLDVYEDTPLANGRIIRGAFTMARFIAIRAGEEGDMPPDFARSDRQRETFMKWWQDGAPFGNRTRNSRPQAELLSELPQADTEPVTLNYEVRDSDRDLVSGSLWVGDRLIKEMVLSGGGTATMMPASFANGDYPIVAHLDDGLSLIERTMGVLSVRHANGNTAPRIILRTALHDALIADLQLPLEVRMTIDDPDTGDVLRLNIEAVRGTEVVPLDQDLPVATGEFTYSWTDTSALTDGPGWRLRLVISDGSASTSLETERLIISHQDTSLRYSDVESLFYEACAACHRGADIPGMDAPNFIAGEDPKAQIDSLRGRIYRRVILEGNMPPPSAPATARQEGLPWRALSADEKATIAEYLLGGSPD